MSCQPCQLFPACFRSNRVLLIIIDVSMAMHPHCLIEVLVCGSPTLFSTNNNNIITRKLNSPPSLRPSTSALTQCHIYLFIYLWQQTHNRRSTNQKTLPNRFGFLKASTVLFSLPTTSRGQWTRTNVHALLLLGKESAIDDDHIAWMARPDNSAINKIALPYRSPSIDPHPPTHPISPSLHTHRLT